MRETCAGRHVGSHPADTLSIWRQFDSSGESQANLGMCVPAGAFAVRTWKCVQAQKVRHWSHHALLAVLAGVLLTRQLCSKSEATCAQEGTSAATTNCRVNAGPEEPKQGLCDTGSPATQAKGRGCSRHGAASLQSCSEHQHGPPCYHFGRVATRTLRRTQSSRVCVRGVPFFSGKVVPTCRHFSKSRPACSMHVPTHLVTSFAHTAYDRHQFSRSCAHRLGRLPPAKFVLVLSASGT